MKPTLILLVIFAIVAVVFSARIPTTENPAPKPVVYVLTSGEIHESNAKFNTTSPPKKAGKRIRNNSKYIDTLDGDSKIQILKINTLDEQSQKMMPHPGQKIRPAPGAYPVYYSSAFVNGKFGKTVQGR